MLRQINNVAQLCQLEIQAEVNMCYEHQLDHGDKLDAWVLEIKAHGVELNRMYNEAGAMFRILKLVLSKSSKAMSEEERRWVLIFHTRSRAENFNHRLR